MKILIIGLGSIAKRHISVLRQILPNSELFALRSNKDAPVYDHVKNLYRIEEIKDYDFRFVIISNPTIYHKDTIKKLIQFKLPLFIEKPVHASLDLDNILQKIKKEKIKTYIACNLRFLDTLKYLKEQILFGETKKINEVNVYCGSYLPEWRPDQNFRDIYSANAELGGGVHLDLIHELDYTYWLFGKPKKVFRFFSKQSSLNISAYDYANYLLEYDGFCVNIILNYFRRDAKRNIELVFEDETLNVNLLNNKIESKNKIIFSSDQRIYDTYELQMQYFIDTINKDLKPFNTIEEGYEVLKIGLEKNGAAK